MPNWMEEIFRNLDPEAMQSWMDGMGSIMEEWFGTTEAKETSACGEEWPPGMMKWCFSCLDAEGRERMFGLCREMLDQFESQGPSQEV